MRLLTEIEMDRVFGGQDSSNVTTLPDVVVTASRQQSSGGYWLGGWAAFAQDEYYGGDGGASACYYTSNYQPLPSPDVPTPEGLRCAIGAAAVPGYGFPAGMSLHMLNSYAYRELTDGAANEGDLLLSSSATLPGDYDGEVYADYFRDGGTSHVYLYAGGMQPDVSTNPYVDVRTGAMTAGVGALTARENQILTLAHEAAHLAGIGHSDHDEAVAEGYGVEALKNFRNGAGAGCPN